MPYCRLMVALVAVTAVACKGKGNEGASSKAGSAASTTAVGSAGSGDGSAGSGDGSAGSADSSAGSAASSAGSAADGSGGGASTKAAALPSNAELGCVGWSAAAKTAACVVGSRGVGEQSAFDTELRLVYVGTDQATELAVGSHDGDSQPYDEDALPAVNAALAADGYMAFTGDGVEADEGKTTQLASGVALSWKKTDKPTVDPEIERPKALAFKLTCGGKTRPLLQDERANLDAKVIARSVPGHVVISVVFAFGFDSDAGESGHAFVVDTATCAVRSAAP